MLETTISLCTSPRPWRFSWVQRRGAQRTLYSTILPVMLSVPFIWQSTMADITTSAGEGPIRTTQNMEENHEPSALPEGSASVIESLTWRLAGQDPAALRIQVKALMERTAGAVIVRDSADQLVTSLPTSELPTLRQALAKLGELSGPAAAESDAPTTLLRVQFVQLQ